MTWMVQPCPQVPSDDSSQQRCACRPHVRRWPVVAPPPRSTTCTTSRSRSRLHRCTALPWRPSMPHETATCGRRLFWLTQSALRPDHLAKRASHQQRRRVFDQLLEGRQEHCGHRSVDNSVIQAERRGHLVADGMAAQYWDDPPQESPPQYRRHHSIDAIKFHRPPTKQQR